MRCRRVRFYLSAYCRSELSEGRCKAVLEHLESCPDCRREEGVLRDMMGALNKSFHYEVSADFSGRLLNRIGAERFSETRTRAFFPKKTPVIGWTRAVPAIATVCLILTFVLTGGLKNMYRQIVPEQIASVTTQNLDNSYMTIQPQSDHVLTQHAMVAMAGKDWAFKSQLARYNRIRSLMNAMQSQNDFASYSSQVIEAPQVCCGPRILIEFPSGVSSMPVTGNSQIRMVSGGEGSN